MKFRAERAQIALLLTPGLAIFALFTVYPIIRLFWMSLCDMSFASMLEQPFAGLANYRLGSFSPFCFRASSASASPSGSSTTCLL